MTSKEKTRKKKSFLEKVIKDILLKNKNTIKFGDDRTIVKIHDKNVINAEQTDGKETIYKGFYTSAQITSNGLYLLVSNVNKHVSEVTVWDAINQIRNNNRKLDEGAIRDEIKKYLLEHKTVLTVYGSLRAYRIVDIDWDKNPEKTVFNRKDGDQIKTITLKDYYKKQYKVDIKHLDQPILIAERKTKAKKKETKKDKAADNGAENNQQQQQEQPIYLIPELLYVTGPTTSNENNKDKRRSAMQKSKTDPNKKMAEIQKIHELVENSTEPKNFRGKDGNSYQGKTPFEVAQSWGINLGDNLTVTGRVLPQPVLLYANENKVFAKNGLFRSGNTFEGANLNSNNFIYVYDEKDSSDIRNSLKGLLDKGRMKGMKVAFSKDLNQNEIHGVAIKNYNNFQDIKNYLKVIEQHKSDVKMAVVFLSPHLERFYSKMKEYFTNELNIPTQFVVSKKLQDPRRAGSIMFNIVEQINVKMGGVNFYINFYQGEHSILDKSKIYLILGLECKQVKDEMHYSLTSTTSRNLHKVITSMRQCKNIKEEKEKAIGELLQSALDGLRNIGKCPHPPDYIILYRQGGNYVQNKKTADNEVPMFEKYLNHLKENLEIFKKYDPKFVYVCCNLKGDLKFFEKGNSGYANPKSGLCVDKEVTQKDKYEFYIQPQYVNQGTATPCHYQVLYQGNETDEKKEEIMKIEQLELLSFYLSFYYWTWAGAIRVPSALKLATTAMSFFSKHLDSKLNLPEQKFMNPIYI
jgi:aubergine-like protein